MRKTPFIVTGALAAALVSAAACAAEVKLRPNVLTVRLPNGAIEQIHYAGKVPPQVDLSPGARPADVAGLGPIFWASPSPFADFDRLSAAMDRQMAVLASTSDGPFAGAFAVPQLSPATLADAPAGAESYSVVSTFSGGRSCVRSIQITAEGPGKAPHVVTKSSGDCVSDATGSAPTTPSRGAPA